jgi:hypothetical protein
VTEHLCCRKYRGEHAVGSLRRLGYDVSYWRTRIYDMDALPRVTVAALPDVALDALLRVALDALSR